jgi:regulator of PEP synthase PpsR (kinase-PPPase family)
MRTRIPKKRIYILSDGSGTTAERVLQASLIQFTQEQASISIVPHVKGAAEVAATVREAAEHRGMIIYTLVSPKLRDAVTTEANERNVVTIDILGPFLTKLSEFLAAPPRSQPGLLEQVDGHYYKRIDAIGFTVKHDDGMALPTLSQADLVIAGVSRTTKTPLSMYLAYSRGLLVANVPIVLGSPAPPQLSAFPSDRVVGVTMRLDVLCQIRRTRFAGLGKKVSLNYAQPDYVRQDLEHSHTLFRRHHWAVVDVTNKSIEESAREICRKTVDRL